MSTEAGTQAPPKEDTFTSRKAVSALLLGGLGLAVMGQSLYAEITDRNRFLLIAIILAGLAAFALAGRLISRQDSPRWLNKPGHRLTRFLGVSHAQLVLLMLAPCFGLMTALAAGDGLKAVNLAVALLAWLFAWLALLAGSYRPGRGRWDLFDRRDVILMLSIGLIAFSLRAIQLGDLPPTLSGDEGSAGLMSLRFINGEADNPFTIGWFSFPTLYFSIQSLGILLFGQTVLGLRITSAVAGALTVVALYAMVRTLFDRMTAVLAALFLTVLHFHVHFSRIGLNNIWDGLFAVLMFGALAYGWKTGKRKGFVFAGFALGLGQYFYVSMRAFPLLLLLWIGAALIMEREKLKRHLPDLLLTGFISFVIVLPLLILFLRNPAEYNAPLQRVTILDGWLEEEIEITGKSAAQILWNQLSGSAMGITHVPLRHWYNPGSPLLLGGAAGLFLLGLLWAITHFDLGALLLFLPLLTVIVSGAISQDAPASQRYIIAAPMAAVLVVLPLAKAANWLKSAWPSYRRVVFIGLALIMSWLLATDLRYYFFEVYDEYVLGGINTEVATAVAHHLQEREPPPHVYFFGFPRMGYYSHATIQYLVPEVEAVEVQEPLTARPSWKLTRPTHFIFLPERRAELEYVRDAFPEGQTQEILAKSGTLLFIDYAVTDKKLSNSVNDFQIGAVPATTP